MHNFEFLANFDSDEVIVPPIRMTMPLVLRELEANGGTADDGAPYDLFQFKRAYYPETAKGNLSA